jgi:purine-cytosine permease-like protein
MDRQYHGQKKKEQKDRSFILAMVLSVHWFTASVLLFFFLLAMVLSVHWITASVLLFFFLFVIVLSVHQTIPWPKEKRTKGQKP